tara:strand:+ start:19688 stop:20146 length:459 start_codon:yes stop_codon:yes gene_type:complete
MTKVEIYKDIVLKNSKAPLNNKVICPCTHSSIGNNPLCGDKIEMFANIKDKIISDVSFQGDGCAISIASASILTQILKGKNLSQCSELIQKFNQMIDKKESTHNFTYLSKDHYELFRSFQSISDFPMRRKCATLSWLTLDSALNNKKNIILT